MSKQLPVIGTAAAEGFAPIDDVVAVIARGGMVVLVDDEDRENEGDLVVAAEFATAEVINFMITHGRGLVCVSITEDRALTLGLGPMATNNTESNGTAFTVSVDGGEEHGVTTGISAHERARTIELVLNGTGSDLRTPGHMFPLVARNGGSLEADCLENLAEVAFPKLLKGRRKL